MAFRLHRVDAAEPTGNATPISDVHPGGRGLKAHVDSRWDEAHMHKWKEAVFELALNTLCESIPSRALASHRRLHRFKW